MKTKIPAIIAAVVGSICATVALLVVLQGTCNITFIPLAVIKAFKLNLDVGFFWRLIYAAVAFWALACIGFVLHRKACRNHAA
jgi:hypothetical protein